MESDRWILLTVVQEKCTLSDLDRRRRRVYHAGKLIVDTGCTDAEMLKQLGTVQVDVFPIKIMHPFNDYVPEIKNMVYSNQHVHPLKGHSAEFIPFRVSNP
jgi:hypothetical protein